MIDLVILLSLALAVTAVMGILLAGFVWVPWLIGLFLAVVLLALMKLSNATLITEGEISADLPESADSPHPPIPDAKIPLMHYRGATYQKADSDSKSPAPTPVCGKYRGQTWRR